MRHYEIVLLIHPDQSEQVPAMLDRYKDMITAGEGLVHRVEDWGRRRLAYMINEVHKAHYAMLNVECGLETLRELEGNFKFNDSIVRSLVIRRARAITEQSPLARARDEEARLDAEKEAARDKSDTAKNADGARESAAAGGDAKPRTEARRGAARGKPAAQAREPKSKPEGSGDDNAAPRTEAQQDAAGDKPAAQALEPKSKPEGSGDDNADPRTEAQQDAAGGKPAAQAREPKSKPEGSGDDNADPRTASQPEDA